MLEKRSNLLKSLGRKHFAAALASSAILTAGCANMVTTAPATDTLSTGSTFGGAVHGGNQPVFNATVQIYEVGQTGVGSAATLVATTTTNVAGAFQFTKGTGSGPNANAATSSSYVCPNDTASDGLLYIKVTGGNTTGNGSASVNNAASRFLAPLGFCSTISTATFVSISEVTTAATVAALAQFINPNTESIGNDGTGAAYQAIGRAFNTIPNLVSASTGLANVSSTVTGTAASVSAVTITVTPEAAKLNTVANILSACINQTSATGTNCTTLFADAVPPPVPSRTSQPLITFPTATDTLQAALYMFINPTDNSATTAPGTAATANRTALYNLPPANPPFQPTITAVPTDWTIAINFLTSNSCGTGTSKFFANPYDVNIDGAGNVWLNNNTTSNGALVAVTSAGTPLDCVTLGGGSHSGVVDINGNVWYADATTNRLYRLAPPTSTLVTGGTVAANSVLTFVTTYPVLAITSDGSGNIFYTSTNGTVGASGTTGFLSKIFDGADATLAGSSTTISQIVGATPSRVFPDAAGDLWVTSGSSFVTEVSSGTGGANYLSNYNSTQFTVASPTYGVVVGPSNRVFISSQDPSATETVLIPSGSTFAVASGFPTASNTAGLTNPAGIFIDGALNSWISDLSTESGSGQGAISIIGADGTAISASGNTNGGYQKSAIYLNTPRMPIVDMNGNVWITNDGSTSSITEIVGAAVPIYQPYATGLQNGRFQSIP